VALNRTFLFAPGNHPRRVEKALALGADAVILDLEDAVAISDKAAARKPVAEALKGPRRCRGYVRPNAPSSPYCYRDLVETIHDKVDGVVLPKVESAADLHAIDWLLAALERERGVSVEVVDLRSIVPLDRNTVLKSVAKTGRAVIADECNHSYGVAAEIAATLAESELAPLKAPVRRVTVPDVPVPYSPPLEAELTVTTEKIIAAVSRVLNLR